MRSSVADGDLAAIIEEAVTEKLERLEAKRYGKTKAPRKSLAETDTSASSRYIPAAVKRAVYERDLGQCAFVDETGRRCKETGRLESITASLMAEVATTALRMSNCSVELTTVIWPSAITAKS